MQFFRRRNVRGRPPHPDVLTPAEWRVLEELRRGHSNAEIAASLGLALPTVKMHVSNMLAKLELHDRHELAAWDGEPAEPSRTALARFALGAPFGWLREAVGATWLGKAALVAGVAAISVGGYVAVAGLSGTAGGGPVPLTPEAPPATVEPTGTPTPEAPYRRAYPAGEPVNVHGAVVFVDPDTGEAEAWVFPGHMSGEFGVARTGDYIVWRDHDRSEYRLFHTDDETDRPIDADRLPVEYAPDGSGFLSTTQDGFVLSAFDARGNYLGDIWLGVSTLRHGAYAWGTRAIALAGLRENNTLRLDLIPLDADGTPGSAPAEPAFGAGVPAESWITARWSHDGERLALVTADRVRVFNLDGAMLWEFEGNFHGNPRWSPTDDYLYVNAMPDFRAEIAYLFTADGQPVFRYWTSFAGACGGEVWLDPERFGFGAYILTTSGDVLDAPRNFAFFFAPDEFGVEVRRPPRGPGWHSVHYGDELLQFLDDGRYVFTTPEEGHGGCAGGLQGHEVEDRLERPPFND